MKWRRTVQSALRQSNASSLRSESGGGLELSSQCLYVEGWLRVSRIHLLECFKQNLRHRPVPNPLLVPGYHVPGNLWRAARDGQLVGDLIFVAVPSFDQIMRREFPPLSWVIQALQQPCPLLLIGYVKANLDDCRTEDGFWLFATAVGFHRKLRSRV